MTLIVRALPFLIDGAELVPVGTQRFRPTLRIGRRAVGEIEDPVLQEIPLGVRLDVNETYELDIRNGSLSLRKVTEGT